jgi:hypothetical protein
MNPEIALPIVKAAREVAIKSVVYVKFRNAWTKVHRSDMDQSL